MAEIIEKYFADSRLIAILRGIRPDETNAVGDALYNAKWRCMEVTMNSPDPLRSIEMLVKRFGDNAIIGGGTVTDPADVAKVVDAGGRFIVAPNIDPEVMAAAREKKVLMMPGIFTPTEAFRAYKLGARYLKLFPAVAGGPGFVNALRSVLPKDAKIIPTGGVTMDTIDAFHAAGSHAFGIGGHVYKAGSKPEDVARRAQGLSNAAKDLE